MPNNEEMVAMILAGGRGTRLKSLTSSIAKPAVYFGGKYRIIDFPLSNVANSGIHTVGVLTQYESSTLNNYIGSGRNWGLNGTNALASILPPRETPHGASWYSGTADAIFQNIDWLDKTGCKYVVILSGDHIYKMDYSEMLSFHKEMMPMSQSPASVFRWKRLLDLVSLSPIRTIRSQNSRRNRNSLRAIMLPWVSISSPIRF